MTLTDAIWRLKAEPCDRLVLLALARREEAVRMTVAALGAEVGVSERTLYRSLKRLGPLVVRGRRSGRESDYSLDARAVFAAVGAETPSETTAKTAAAAASVADASATSTGLQRQIGRRLCQSDSSGAHAQAGASASSDRQISQPPAKTAAAAAGMKMMDEDHEHDQNHHLHAGARPFDWRSDESVRLFYEVSSTMPNERDFPAILRAHAQLGEVDEAKKRWLVHVHQTWASTRRQDGRTYSSKNPNWFTNWAVLGIPERYDVYDYRGWTPRRAQVVPLAQPQAAPPSAPTVGCDDCRHTPGMVYVAGKGAKKCACAGGGPNPLRLARA